MGYFPCVTHSQALGCRSDFCRPGCQIVIPFIHPRILCRNELPLYVRGAFKLQHLARPFTAKSNCTRARRGYGRFLHKLRKNRALPGKRNPPNIILIVADDMGFSDAGCYGGEIQTPNLDSLARNGLRFTQFYNTARCWPSRACILTGYYAQAVRRDTMPGVAGGNQGVRPTWARLLPEYLKPLGYRCYHSGKWHIDGKPLNNGFDHSFDVNGDGQNNYFKSGATEDGRPVPQTPDYYATTAVAEHADPVPARARGEISPTGPSSSIWPSPRRIFPCKPRRPTSPCYRDTVSCGLGRRCGKSATTACGRWISSIARFPRSNRRSGRIRICRRKRSASESAPARSAGPLRGTNLTDEQKKFQPIKMAIHAAMVHRMDAEIGRVIDQVKAMGALENTVDSVPLRQRRQRGTDHPRRRARPGRAARFGPNVSLPWTGLVERGEHAVAAAQVVGPRRRHFDAADRPLAGRHQGPRRTAVESRPHHRPGAHDPRSGRRHSGRRRSTASRSPPPHGKSLVPAFARDGTVAHDFFWWYHVGNRALRVGDWKIVATQERPVGTLRSQRGPQRIGQPRRGAAREGAGVRSAMDEARRRVPRPGPTRPAAAIQGQDRQEWQAVNCLQELPSPVVVEYTGREDLREPNPKGYSHATPCRAPVVPRIAVPFARWSIAADSDSDEAKAVAEIEKLGGQVTLDTESPTRPVIAIDLAETKVADGDLEQLKVFARLETLNLDHTEITDAGLEHLKELSRLQVLGLWDTKITDAGLEQLKGLTKLRQVGPGTRPDHRCRAGASSRD